MRLTMIAGRPGAFALAAALSLSLPAGPLGTRPAAAQSVPVAIPPAAVAAVAEACAGSGADCTGALETALAGARAGAPDASARDLLGALAAELAAAGNAAIAAGNPRRLMLSRALAALSGLAGDTGLPDLALGALGASRALAAGAPVDLTAVASGLPARPTAPAGVASPN